jgi:hypothetical protein
MLEDKLSLEPNSRMEAACELMSPKITCENKVSGMKQVKGNDDWMVFKWRVLKGCK